MFEIGTIVVVIDDKKSKEWEHWRPEMNIMIGKKTTIINTYDSYPYRVKLDCGDIHNYWFPVSALVTEREAKLRKILNED